MKKFLCVSLFFAMAASAHAMCHFRTPAALLCFSPKAAAIAYQKFGDDYAAAHVSYTRELLHEAGCVLVSKEKFASIALYKESEGRTATPSGWIDVEGVYIFPRGDTYYVAKNYLTGKCEKPSPDNESNIYLPTIPKYAMPTGVMP